MPIYIDEAAAFKRAQREELPPQMQASGRGGELAGRSCIIVIATAAWLKINFVEVVL